MESVNGPAQRLAVILEWLKDGWHLAELFFGSSTAAVTAYLSTSLGGLVAAPATVAALTAGFGAVQLVRWGRRAKRRRSHPSRIEISCEGGMKATVTLRHFGEPTAFTAEGRIVGVANTVNPAEQVFDCHCATRPGSPQRVILGDDQWAGIVLGQVQINEHGDSHLEMRRGPLGVGVGVGNGPAIVELRIKPEFAVSGGSLTQRFRVSRAVVPYIVTWNACPQKHRVWSLTRSRCCTSGCEPQTREPRWRGHRRKCLKRLLVSQEGIDNSEGPFRNWLMARDFW
jgi:hypothetical protein